MLSLFLREEIGKIKPYLVRSAMFSMLSGSQRTSLERGLLNLPRQVAGNSAGKNKCLSVRPVSILRAAL